MPTEMKPEGTGATEPLKNIRARLAEAHREVKAIRERVGDEYRHEPGEQYTPMLRDLRFLLGVLGTTCAKCNHYMNTDPRGRCIEIYYDAGGSLCYCDCKCSETTNEPQTS